MREQFKFISHFFKKIIYNLLIGISTFFILIILLLFLIFHSETEIIETIPSPENKFIAEVVRSNGGATTGYSYDVNIIDNQCFSIKKRVAQFESPIQNNGDYGLELSWTSRNELTIHLYSSNESNLQIKTKNICGNHFSIHVIQNKQSVTHEIFKAPSIQNDIFTVFNKPIPNSSPFAH